LTAGFDLAKTFFFVTGAAAIKLIREGRSGAYRKSGDNARPYSKIVE